MNKKGNDSINEYDYIEDNEIKRMAAKKVIYNDIYFIAVFLIMIGIIIGIYLINGSILPKGEVTEINSNGIFVTINNDGKISERINSKLFNRTKKYTIEKIDYIEIERKDESNNSKVLYNVKYEITDNRFPLNAISTADSNVLVRFAYSYDKKEWNYIANVLSLSDTNITPLMGKYYDISGITGIVKVVSDRELDSNKIYWKSVTTFHGEDLNNNYVANFKIEYSKITD